MHWYKILYVYLYTSLLEDSSMSASSNILPSGNSPTIVDVVCNGSEAVVEVNATRANDVST